MNNQQVLEAIQEVEAELGEDGRVLVRPSGTEPLLRVMVEAETEEQCEKYADQIATIIDKLFGFK